MRPNKSPAIAYMGVCIFDSRTRRSMETRLRPKRKVRRQRTWTLFGLLLRVAWLRPEAACRSPRSRPCTSPSPPWSGASSSWARRVSCPVARSRSWWRFIRTRTTGVRTRVLRGSGGARATHEPRHTRHATDNRRLSAGHTGKMAADVRGNFAPACECAWWIRERADLLFCLGLLRGFVCVLLQGRLTDGCLREFEVFVAFVSLSVDKDRMYC